MEMSAIPPSCSPPRPAQSSLWTQQQLHPILSGTLSAVGRFACAEHTAIKKPPTSKDLGVPHMVRMNTTYAAYTQVR